MTKQLCSNSQLIQFTPSLYETEDDSTGATCFISTPLLFKQFELFQHARYILSSVKPSNSSSEQIKPVGNC